MDRFLVFFSSLCPFCRGKRRWPASAFARFMLKLEPFCPFCRAYARLPTDKK